MFLTHFDQILGDLNLLVELLSFVGDEPNWAGYCSNTLFVFTSFHIFGFLAELDPFVPSFNNLGAAWIDALNNFDLGGYRISIFIRSLHILC